MFDLCVFCPSPPPLLGRPSVGGSNHMTLVLLKLSSLEKGIFPSLLLVWGEGLELKKL